MCQNQIATFECTEELKSKGYELVELSNVMF